MIESPTSTKRTAPGGVAVQRFVSQHVGTPQTFLFQGRVLVWFSCGAASACAAKLAVEKHKDKTLEIIYCDTLKYEHPDNVRFLKDVEQWIQWPVKIMRSKEYADIFDVFDKTGWLVGPHGARCTTELKKNVRKEYQWPEYLHIFGLTADEPNRIRELQKENHEIFLEWNLRDAGMVKRDCLKMVADAGIQLPAMYRMGYHNNNCIGCVKGGMGYWNKIRKDFPEAFARMAAQERKMGATINRRNDMPLYLDELEPTAGRFENEPDIECGPQCRMPVLANS